MSGVEFDEQGFGGYGTSTITYRSKLVAFVQNLGVPSEYVNSVLMGCVVLCIVGVLFCVYLLNKNPKDNAQYTPEQVMQAVQSGQIQTGAGPSI